MTKLLFALTLFLSILLKHASPNQIKVDDTESTLNEPSVQQDYVQKPQHCHCYCSPGPRGPPGPPGPRGPPGPANPKQSVQCKQVSTKGNRSQCPTGYTVTGCACGHRCGSWNTENGNTRCYCHIGCMNGNRPLDWTLAICCKVA